MILTFLFLLGIIFHEIESFFDRNGEIIVPKNPIVLKIKMIRRGLGFYFSYPEILFIVKKWELIADYYLSTNDFLFSAL